MPCTACAAALMAADGPSLSELIVRAGGDPDGKVGICEPCKDMGADSPLEFGLTRGELKRLLREHLGCACQETRGADYTPPNDSSPYHTTNGVPEWARDVTPPPAEEQEAEDDVWAGALVGLVLVALILGVMFSRKG